jgi:hypothetical protein
MEGQEQMQHEGEGLWEQIFSRNNLFAALERVQKNGGAPGIDGMTVEELPDHLRKHWEGIRAKLDRGSYVPSPVKRIEIPKPNGGMRQLALQPHLISCHDLIDELRGYRVAGGNRLQPFSSSPPEPVQAMRH